MSQKNSFVEDIDIAYAYKYMQKTCINKCLEDVSKPLLNPAEQSCLHRCAIKYREALQFGIDMLKYQEKEIKDANDLSKKYPLPLPQQN